MTSPAPHSRPPWKFLLALFLAFGAGGFAGLFFGMVATDPGDNLTLVKTAFTVTESGERTVTGAIRNNTDAWYSHIQVDIALLDLDGNVVERTFTTANDVAPGHRWEFTVPVTSVEAVRAVIDGQCGRRYHFRTEIEAAAR